MPYLIDSDVLIAQRESQPGALVLLEQLAPQGLAISIVTYMEVYQVSSFTTSATAEGC